MTGQTNWSPYDVPHLAGILNDNLDTAWEQVFAWLKAQAMLDDASSTLAAARKGLADVWPPESSPAAMTFFEVVDELTASMRQTSLASNSNANALANVLDNHASTRSNIDQLHARWSMLQKLSYADPAGVGPTDQWRSSLNAEAQQHMAASDAVINEYAATLVVPPVIRVPTSYDPETLLPAHHSASPGAGGSNGPSQGGSSGRRPISGRPESTSKSGGRASIPDLGVVSEPVLTAAPTPSAGGPKPGANPPGAAPSIASSDQPNASVPLVVPGGAFPFPAGVGRPTPLAAGADGRLAPATIGRPNTIGADGTIRPAHVGDGVVDVSNTTDSTARDGVERTRAGSSVADEFMSPMMASSAATTGERTRRSLTISAWHVPSGGPAVLAPSYETDIHDPGPGVIGIDR